MRETPRSSVERGGLTIQPIDLSQGFESQRHHVNTRRTDGRSIARLIMMQPKEHSAFHSHVQTFCLQ